MAIVSRAVKVIRYFKAEVNADGAPVPGTEDEDIWIDIETLIGFVTEQGSGITFKRRSWELDQNSTERSITWKKIYKDEDNDPDAWVPVPIYDVAHFESGAGISFRRFSQNYDNSEDNKTRKTSTFQVFHAEFDSNGNVDIDKDVYINVEVIDTYNMEYGAGISFRREIWSPDNSVVPNSQYWGLRAGEYKVADKPGKKDDETVWPSSCMAKL